MLTHALTKGNAAEAKGGKARQYPAGGVGNG